MPLNLTAAGGRPSGSLWRPQVNGGTLARPADRMIETNHFKLTLGIPKHGWLPFRVELDSFVLDDAASNVLSDPLDDLLELLSFSIKPLCSDVRVCFWMEPGGYALDGSYLSAANRFSLRFYFDHHFVPPMRDRTMDLRFAASLSGQMLTAGLVAGVRPILAHPDSTAIAKWRREGGRDFYLLKFEPLLRSIKK